MGRLDTRYIIKLDTKATFLNPTLEFSINDTETSDLYIRVTNKHKLIDVSNMIPVIVVIDPHGQLYSDFMEVTEDNLLYYDVKKTMKSQSGKHIAKVMLVDNQEKKVLKGNFSYIVEDDEISLLDEKVGEDDRLPILTEFISRLSTIENLELSRQEAETNRVESEKLRQEAIEKVKTDIAKLISDTNNKVANNLTEQNNKVTKLISDTETKIDNYKTEKDEAIQQDLQLYKQETTKNIDDYKVSKDSEINKNLSDYKTNTTNDINNYKNLKNTEINNYKAEKDLEIDNYIATKNKEIDDYKLLKDSEINKHVADSKSDLENYKVAKNTEIDEYKNLKDTLINGKVKEVDDAKASMVSSVNSKIIEIDNKTNELTSTVTDKVAEADTRIQELQGFESQLGQIQTDVNDLKNNGTGGNANIDDTQVSKETTWSSDKISTWNIEQDGVFWTEKEGNFISASDTYEYKLKEIEIFGDTWQDTENSLNIFNVKNLINGKLNGTTGAFESATNYCATNDYIKVDYTKKLELYIPVDYVYVGITYDKDKNFVRNAYIKNNTLYTLNEGEEYLKIFFRKTDSSNFEPNSVLDDIYLYNTDILISKYESYHKADLSNIQHAGELYVDEEGQPILDSEGREQYKFEIEVCNANLVKPDMEMVKGTYHDTTGIFTENPSGNGRCTKDFIRVGSGGKYSYKLNSEVEPLWLRVLCFDSNYKFLGCPLGIISTVSKNNTFTMPTDTKFIKIQHLNGEKISTSNLTIIKSDTVVPYDIPHKYHKQTILLPCQLSKVGDVKDRLFWDNEKGRYVVEKNVEMAILNGLETWRIDRPTETHQTMYIDKNSHDEFANFKTQALPNMFSSYTKKVVTTLDTWTAIEKCMAYGNNDRYFLMFRVDKSEYDTISSWTTELIKNNITVYFECETPQLIETNITTPITIPTFSNKTHVYINNSNNAKATIKAKFPLKTASAVASVKELGLKNSNSIQEQYEVNQTQDELINISLLATDEMYMMIEPLLEATNINERMVSKMVDMYVAMVIRGLKTIDEVPARYREQVKEILSKLEK